MIEGSATVFVVKDLNFEYSSYDLSPHHDCSNENISRPTNVFGFPDVLGVILFSDLKPARKYYWRKLFSNDARNNTNYP